MTREEEARTEVQKSEPNGTTLCSIAHLAGSIGQNAHAAYWLEANGMKIDYHLNKLHKDLVDLASFFEATVTFPGEADQ